MAGGYTGKILHVDLSNATMRSEILDENFYRKFIGGYGIGASILFSEQRPGIDPLGPENTLGFAAGLLTGTSAITAARFTVMAKSPLTGTWGDANAGGHFGPHLKFAGWDAVFFTGISEKPVYLYIEEDGMELRSATDLWGKDTFELEDLLKSQLGDDAHIVCIGPAGEKLSLIAGIINDKGRAAARSGLGAVMGSKKLKALVVKGTLPVPIADMVRVKDLRRHYLRELGTTAMGEHYYSTLKEFGTPGLLRGHIASGLCPVKNFGGIGFRDFPNVDALGGESVKSLQIRKDHCWRCPVGCGGVMKEGTQYNYAAGAYKPEYETLSSFGTRCLNDNLESIIKANDICNRYGLDTISAGATISFAIECYENGIITREDTDGIELTWGNHASIVAMTQKMAVREGFGEILADGVKAAAERIGNGAEQYAMHIQGEEIPGVDPRVRGGDYYTVYVLDATPARHTQRIPLLEGMPAPPFDEKIYSDRGKARKIANHMMHIVNTSGSCYFFYLFLPRADYFPDMISAVTGWDVSMEELLETGERIGTLRHAFNLREGLNPLRFGVPPRVMGIPPDDVGPLKGITVDGDTLRKDYVEAMNWDPVTTKPSPRRLMELGLEHVIDAIK